MPCADGKPLIGWDIGGAHVKACLLEGGKVRDVAQWAAPLWQGLAHLDAAIASAACRWSEFGSAGHALTMTAEMIDLFPDREAGVLGLSAHLAKRLGPELRFFAGSAEWPTVETSAAHWRGIASANWLATAHLVAAGLPTALLIDIGSTTTDLIPIANSRPSPLGHSDADRLASGELVYLGVVRTPLCALTRRIAFAGREFNVMNEFFATTADVFRLSAELDPVCDQHPAADGGDKSAAASCRRLARMIGMDARDAEFDEWIGFAAGWRQVMIDEIASHLDRVVEAAALPATPPLVAAGCGGFLVRELAMRSNRPWLPFHTVANLGPAAAGWADTCAPSVAVAMLFERWRQTCG